MSTLVCLWSDWHIGEQIGQEAGQVFTSEIAARRVDSLLSRTEQLVELHRPSQVLILGLGDFISGIIHAELLEEADHGVVEQVELAGELISWAFGQLSRAVRGRALFYGLSTDNHSRMTEKPRYKQRYKTNLSYLCLKHAEMRLPPAARRRFQILKGISEVIDLTDGSSILVTHGDQIRSYSGLPLLGIERYRDRELLRRIRTYGKGFDILVLGHFHMPVLFSNTIVINGSLCGPNEYAVARGLYSPPSQVAFTIRKHHLEDFHIIHLS